jgi:hypothetical protein
LLVREIFKRDGWSTDPGIIEKNIEPVVFVFDRREQLVHSFGPAYIGWRYGCATPNGLYAFRRPLEFGSSPPRQDNRVTALCQCDTDCAANTATSTRYERHLLVIHASSLLFDVVELIALSISFS